MKLYSIIGSQIVILALLFYTIGFVRIQRRKFVARPAMLFYSFGLLFDITATVLMILGSSKGMFTLHGFLGYSSLLGMCIDIILLWRVHMDKEGNKPVSKSLNLYSRVAFIWWLVAFVTGAALVLIRYIH